MTWKERLKAVTKKSDDLRNELKRSNDASPNIKKLEELLDEDWGDEERSDVHIENHYHVPEPVTRNDRYKSQYDSVPTKPENEIPEQKKRHTLSPRAKRISVIVSIIATGLVAAGKLVWELYWAWSN